MEFEANQDFYLGKPRIDRVILRFSLGDEITELLSGEVDADRVPPSSLSNVAGDPRFRIYHHISAIAAHAVYWKSDHAILGDPMVRRALTHAIDRRALQRVLNYPDDLPIFDAPHTPDQYRRRELPEPLPYDPARARALLDSTGWRDGDGDEIRDREGRPLRFTALVENMANSGTVSGAIFVQSELQKVGVQMDLQPFDRSVVWERLQSGDFEAVFFSFRFWEAPVLQDRYHLGKAEPLGYRNPQVVELLSQASRNWVPEEDDRIYRELAEIFRRDMPITILYPYASFAVAHRRLRGLSSPYWGGDPTAHMDELWLENEP
jgi:peptide/nickel transport system substrate-binding protein